MGERREAPPLRLTRRGRAVVVMGVALLSLGGFWLGTRAASVAAVEPAGAGGAGTSWVEEETARGIAGGTTGEGLDPMAGAGGIKRFHGLSGSLIRAGARLYVPGDAAAP
jgi:hypothetical protein